MRTLCWSLCCLPGSLLGQEWTTLPDFPGLPRDDAAAFVLGADIYVGTGMDVGFNLTADWYRFNTIDQSWSPVAGMPGGGRQYALAMASNGHGYVIGGTTGAEATDEVWRYDANIDQWSQQAPLLTAVLAAAGGPHQGQLHVIGGIGSNGTVAALHQVHDVLAGTWSLAEPPPMSVHRAAGFVLGDGPHMAGGATQDFEGTDQHLRYDANGAVWSSLAALPDGRYACDASAVHAGAVLLGGVRTGPPLEVRGEVWRYDPWADAWSAMPPLPSGPRRGAVLVEAGGRLYFGTGSDATQRYQDWWTLELPVRITEGSFASPAPFPVPTSGPVHVAAALLPTDRLLRLVTNSGQEVRRWPPSTQMLDLSGLAPGSYVLLIEGDVERRHRLVKTP